MRVRFVFKTDIVGKLLRGINDHLVTLRFPLSGKKHATIISAYVPTMTYQDEVKFYDDLDGVISATPVQTSPSFLLTSMPELAQTWDLIVSVPDHRLSFYFGRSDSIRRHRQMQQ